MAYQEEIKDLKLQIKQLQDQLSFNKNLGSNISILLTNDILFNNIPIGLVVIKIKDKEDISGNKIIKTNDFFHTICDFERNALVGKCLTDMLNKEVLKPSFYRSLTYTSSPVVLDTKVGQNDKHFNITFLKVSDDIIVCSFNDFSRLKEAQDTISFERNLFQTLLNKFPDAIYFKDNKARFLRASLHLTQVFHTTPNEIIGKTDFDFYSKSLAEKKFADDMNVIKTGMPIINKIEKGNVVGNDVRWLSTTKLPLFNREGEIEGLFGISRDITDKKLAEEKELEYKKNLITLTESSIELLKLNSIKEIFINLCKTLEKQFKSSIVLYNDLSKNNYKVETCSENDDHLHIETLFNKNNIVEKILDNAEFKKLYDKGKIISCNTDIKNCFIQEIAGEKFNELNIKHKYILSLNDSNKIAGLFIILMKNGIRLTDKNFVETFIQQSSLIIHRKKLEEQLIVEKDRAEESDNLKSSFLANLSHEIRTPINAIQGFGELLKMEDIEMDKKHEYIEIIQEKSGQLIQIIADIIDISKFESNQVNVVETERNLNDFLFGIQSDFEHKLAKYIKKDIKLNLVKGLNDNESNITTDFNHVKKIFENLLTNAIKFTLHGVIEMGYRKNGALLEFFVADTGIGVPEDKKDIIFLRFRQVDESRTRKYGGTGLGLTISKSIIDLLKGKIWVEDAYMKDFSNINLFDLYDDLKQKEKLGARFMFTIPCKQTSPKETIEQTDTDHSDWSNKNILVVEDDSFNYHYIYEVLKINEPNLYHCKNGKEAIDYFEEKGEQTDIILMDLQMPVMDGYEATKAIRKINKNIPIIVQTAYSMPEDSTKATDAGATDLIVKPYTSTALVNIIQKYINSQ